MPINNLFCFIIEVHIDGNQDAYWPVTVTNPFNSSGCPSINKQKLFKWTNLHKKHKTINTYKALLPKTRFIWDRVNAEVVMLPVNDTYQVCGSAVQMLPTTPQATVSIAATASIAAGESFRQEASDVEKHRGLGWFSWWYTIFWIFFFRVLDIFFFYSTGFYGKTSTWRFASTVQFGGQTKSRFNFKSESMMNKMPVYTWNTCILSDISS